MNLPRVYTCSPSWSPLPPPSLYHSSGSSHYTSPKHPVSCIEPGLAIHFLYDIIHVSMPFSQIILPSPSPTKSKRLFYISVSLLLSRIQGYHYYLSVIFFIKSVSHFIFIVYLMSPGYARDMRWKSRYVLVLRCTNPAKAIRCDKCFVVVLIARSCLTVWYLMDCSLPGSSVHRTSQARILEWVAISFSRISSWPRGWIASPVLVGKFFTTEPPGKPVTSAMISEIGVS